MELVHSHKHIHTRLYTISQTVNRRKRFRHSDASLNAVQMSLDRDMGMRGGLVGSFNKQKVKEQTLNNRKPDSLGRMTSGPSWILCGQFTFQHFQHRMSGNARYIVWTKLFPGMAVRPGNALLAVEVFGEIANMRKSQQGH